MNLLQDPPQGFQAIAKAFAMAKHMPTTHKLAVKIGLARDGALFAAGQLDGYRQVTFFSEHLRDLGYHEHLLGGDEDMFDCDMLFSLPPQSEQRQDTDPSFIRRPAVQLWPVRG